MDDLLRKHAQEEKFTLSKVAQLAKPRLGQKPLPADALSEQSAKLLGDLRARHAAEVAALTESLARMAVEAPAPAAPAAAAAPAAGDEANATPTPDAAAAAATPAAATAAAPAAATPAEAPAADSGAGGGKKKTRAQRRSEKKAAARAGADSDGDEGGGGGGGGPDAREVELAAIAAQLAPQGLEIKPVPADGNCLFRAVSDQLLLLAGAPASVTPSSTSVPDYATLRRRAAEHIAAHWASFAPFLPYEPGDGYPEGGSPDPAAVRAAVGAYTARMGRSAAWGGHPELRALSCVLGLPVVVYQAGAPPFTITPDAESMGDGGGTKSGGRRRRGSDDDDRDRGATNSSSSSSLLMADPSLTLRLSFHRTYFTLGEHYNSVAPAATAAAPKR